MGVLRAKVNGAWLDVAGTPPPLEEVHVGSTDPYITDPLATDELWYDTTTGTLMARVFGVWEPAGGAPGSIDELTDVDTTTTAPADGDGLVYDDALGQWVPGPGGSEVEVDAVEPTGDWELWVDTSALAPPPGVTSLAIDDLTDVDTATTAPAAGNGLVWDGTSQWAPQPVWKMWAGSQAEFDAIPVKDDTTLYAIV